jgi:hypothetical protein
LQRIQPAHQHRAHRQRGHRPAAFVAHQHPGALQQRAHAPRHQPVLRDEGDILLARQQPAPHLHFGGARFLLQTVRAEQAQLPPRSP